MFWFFSRANLTSSSSSQNLRDHYSSSSSSSSRSSYSRSNSASSISSTSLDRNDKDYRFEPKEKDIDERFPHDNADMLIVDCPNLDDDLRIDNKRTTKSSDHDERKLRKAKSPSLERPVSITVKLNTSDFDLRQLIKKRRTDESTSTAAEKQRLVQIGSNDNHLVVHKPIHHRLSSRRTEKNSKH